MKVTSNTFINHCNYVDIDRSCLAHFSKRYICNIKSIKKSCYLLPFKLQTQNSNAHDPLQTKKPAIAGFIEVRE